MFEASDKSIVYYLERGAASIDTASPASDLVKHHRETSDPINTSEIDVKGSTAKHMARINVFDMVAAMRAFGLEVTANPELARFN